MRKLFVILLSLMLTIAVYGSSHSSSSKKSYSSGSGKSYSSSKSSGSSSKSYSSGSKSYSSGSKSPSEPSKSKSSGFSFFGKAEKAQAKADSKAKYEQYKVNEQPKTARYEKYKASSQSYDFLKKQPKEVYTTRTTRERSTFSNYYNSPQQPTVVYKDSGWNPFFWLWLLDHKDSQAEWVYHHRKELSDERYKELLDKNKDLEKQIKEIEDKKVAQDPSYAPKGVDKDLMYSDEYAKEAQDDSSSFLWWLLGGTLFAGVATWGAWQVFFKKRDL